MADLDYLKDALRRNISGESRPSSTPLGLEEEPEVALQERPPEQPTSEAFLDSIRRVRKETGEEPGVFETVGKGVVRGAEGMLGATGSITRWIGDVAGIEPVSNAGEYWSNYWEKAQQEGFAAPDPFVFRGTFLENPSLKRAFGIVGEAVPSLAAALTASMVTGGTSLGAWLGGALGVSARTAGHIVAATGLGALEGAPQYEEAVEAGKGVTEASAYGMLSTAGTAVLEFLPIARMLDAKAVTGLRKGVLRFAEFGGEEAGQEAAQQLVQNLIAKVGYDDTRQLFEGIVESMIGGFGAGAIAGGTANKLNNVLNRNREFFESPEGQRAIDDANDVIIDQTTQKADDVEVDQGTQEILDEAAEEERRPEAALEIPEFESTEEAEQFGLGATPEQVEALSMKEAELRESAEQQKEAGELEESMATAQRAQFLREARETAERGEVRDFTPIEEPKVEAPEVEEEPEAPEVEEEPKKPAWGSEKPYPKGKGRPMGGAISTMEPYKSKAAAQREINKFEMHPSKVATVRYVRDIVPSGKVVEGYMPTVFNKGEETEWQVYNDVNVSNVEVLPQSWEVDIDFASKDYRQLLQQNKNLSFDKSGVEKVGDEYIGWVEDTGKQVRINLAPMQDLDEAKQTAHALVMGAQSLNVKGFEDYAPPIAEAEAEKIGGIGQFNVPYLSEVFLGDIKSGEAEGANKIKLQKRVADILGMGRTTMVQNEFFQHKPIEEAFEYALVKRAREIAAEQPDTDEAYQKLKKLYEGQPLLGTRTGTSMKAQAYSTPVHLAYLMQKAAGVDKNTMVYEPNAGTGMLLSLAEGANVWANELDRSPDATGARIRILEDTGFMTSNLDAAEAVPSQQKRGRPVPKAFDVVMANPPFGSIPRHTYKGYKVSKLEHKHVMNALDAMKDNGRAAFIIGGQNFEDGRMNNTQRVFLNWLYHNYNVVANIDIPGKQYARQGSSFPVRMIVVHGRKATPEGFAPTEESQYTKVESVDDILPIAKELENAISDQIPGAGAPAGAPAVLPSEEGPGGVGAAEGEAEPGELPPVLPGQGGEATAGGEIPPGTVGEPSPRVGGQFPTDESLEGVPGAIPGALPGRGEVGGEVAPGERGTGEGVPGAVELGERPEGAGEREGVSEGAQGPGIERVSESDTNLENIKDLSADNLDNIFSNAKADMEGETIESPPPSDLGIDAPRVETRPHKVPTLNFQKELDRSPADFGDWWERRNKIYEKKKPRKRAAKGPRKPQTPTEALKGAGSEAIKALSEGLSGLDALFGGSKLSMGVTFDEGTYAQAKPHFEASWQHAVAAKYNFQQFIKLIFERYGTRVEPYLRRWVAEKQEEQREESDYQIKYEPRSKGPIISETLMPRKMLEAVQKALDTLEGEVGNIDDFVMKELQYESKRQLFDALSGDQVDGVALALKNIKNRTGMIVGDQTGVGKGRIGAAIVRYAHIQGLKPIFLTDKANLFTDFYRDIVDIGHTVDPFIFNANAKVYDQNGKSVFEGLGGSARGRMFRNIRRDGADALGRHDTVFATYSQFQNPRYPASMNALRELAPNNIIILDEAHLASGDSNRGQFVRQIIENAQGVLYMSATYAKRPATMPLYYRTDMSRSNLSFPELVRAIEHGGIPLQEILANNLAIAGQYIRRELSFAGIDNEYVVDSKNRVRDEEMSDKMTDSIRDILEVDDMIGGVLNGIIRDVRNDGGVIGGVTVLPGVTVAGTRMRATVSASNFAATVHNAVRMLLFAMKADMTVSTVLAELEKGNRVVVSVANTLGSFMEDAIDTGAIKVGDNTGDLTFSHVLERYLRRSLQFTVTQPTGEKVRGEISVEDLPPQVREEYERVQRKIREIVTHLPGSPIDYVKAAIAKAGYSTDELTGRDYWADLTDPDTPMLARRKASDKNRNKIVNGFNNGKIDVLLINQSGSTGISLHSSPQFKDQRPRVMVVGQTEQNIDTEVQKMGRINRKGQVNLPRYLSIILDIPAEIRPSTVFMKKLKSLSANTSANSDSPLAQQRFPDLNNRYGDRVVRDYLQNMTQAELHALRIGREDPYLKVSGKFGIQPVARQKDFFETIEDDYDALIADLKEDGAYDLEVTDINFQAKTSTQEVLTVGTDESHPFARSTFREALTVKALKKAYNKHKLDKVVKERLGDKTAEQVSEDYISELRELTGEYLEGVKPRMDEERFTRLQQETDTNLDRLEDNLVDRYGAYKIGNYYSLRGVAGMTHSAMNAVLIDIRLAPGKSNPANASRTRLTFAVNNALQKYTAPLSKIFAGRISTYPKEDYRLQYWDSDVDETLTDTRYMITGNLLQGFADAPSGSRIVRFSMENGRMREGILMPLNYDADEDNQTVRVTADQAATLLHARVPLVGTDVHIAIPTYNTEEFVITVPQTRAAGGRYFMDDTLKGLTVTGDFETRGGRMRAMLREENMVEAINRIYDLGESFSVNRRVYDQHIGDTQFRVADRAIGRVNAKQVRDFQRLVGVVRQAFRKAGLSQDVIDKIGVDFKEILDLRGKDIDRTVNEWAREGKSINAILGATTINRYNALMQLSLQQDLQSLEKTALHESFHIFAKWILPQGEYNQIMKHFKTEEAAAEAFADYVAARGDARTRPAGAIRGLFLKLKRLLQAVGNALRGRGLTTPEAFWQKITTQQYIPHFGRGQPARTTIAFSGEERAPVWFSQMERHVNDKLPGKGTGKSYAQTIQSWAKKGEFKQEELEWSGLLDWLKGQDKLTKNEVLDYMRENNLKLQETEKGDSSNAPPPELPEILKNNGFSLEIEPEIHDEGYEANLYYDAFQMPDGTFKRDRVSDPIEVDGPYEVRREVQRILSKLEAWNRKNATKFGEWTEQGGENYRELLLQMPSKPVDVKLPDRDKFTAKVTRHNIPTQQRDIEVRYDGKWVGTRTGTRISPEEVLDDYYANMVTNYTEAEEKKVTFRDSHWGEPNVVAHARFNERHDEDGSRVLFLEEVQSDWHQKGRKEGYRREIPFTKDDIVIDEAEHEYKISVKPPHKSTAVKAVGKGVVGSIEEARDYAYRTIKDQYKPIIQGVPEAPFKTTWPMLVMKRMVRYAAEHGYDKIAWTPGEIQAARYDLSKYANYIAVSQETEGGQYYVAGEDKNGWAFELGTFKNAEALKDAISKDLADKAIKQLQIQDKPSVINFHGIDLKVGGEGMKSFYDRLLVNEMNKFFGKKKWGKARAKTSGISMGDHQRWVVLTDKDIRLVAYTKEMANDFVKTYNGKIVSSPEMQEVWSIKITPEMREKALTEGFTQFRIRPRRGNEDRRQRRSRVLNEVLSHAPEAKERIQKAFGLTGPKLGERIKAAAKETVATFTPGRMFPQLSTKHFGKEIEILRHFLEIPNYSKTKAIRTLRYILDPENMTPEQYDMFSTKILLDDMIKDMDAEDGPLANWEELIEENGEIAFGFTSREEVVTALEHLNEMVAGDTMVTEALERRENFMAGLRRDLVNNKLLEKEVLDDPRYWHHQVLEYANARMSPRIGVKDLTLPKYGYQIHRIGSIKDYNTHYVESEFEVIAQGIRQLETIKDQKALKESNIMGDLRREARDVNLAKAEAMWVAELGDAIEDEHPLRFARQKIAMAFSNLGRMALAGDLDVPARFEDVVEELALREELGEDAALYEETGDVFGLLKWLVDTGNPGASWAATAFKGIQERNGIIKDALGPKFETWQTRMTKRAPREGSEGWATWKPRPRTAWFMTNSIKDNLLAQYFEGVRELHADDVQQVLARGVDETWVIPAELAEVMNGKEFMHMPADNIAARFAEKSLNWWKRWILINPARIFKYNFNNLSGDLDIVLAYNPKILKYTNQAIKDLWAWQYNKEMSPELEQEFDIAMRDSVVGSGMTVHDIPDVSANVDLKKLMEALNGNTANALRYIERFWQGSKNFTVWRENILRLAAYRYFKDVVASGQNAYGASDHYKVDATTDPDRKAALLARELIGDYGGLSKGGNWLRRKAIPFYSWMEINAPRYYRMYRNLAVEGRGPGDRLRFGGVMLKKGAFLTAKMAMLYGAVNLFNHLFWPDEEEELGEVGRRQLHLILGRRSDGSVMTLRFQGALSDALAFFGLEDAPEDMKDVARGRKTIAKWMAEMPYEFTNKFVQGVRPDVKIPFELMSGRAFFPEWSKPRPIRDRLEHVSRLFSIETIYRRVANKPIRGGTIAGRLLNDLSSLVSYTADPGEVAYHTIRRYGNEFLKERNLERPSREPTTRMNALYYYKKALKYGDAKAAEKYLSKYKELGGNLSRLRISIKNTHPLSMIPKKYRGRFMKSLSAKEKQTLKRAKEWYRKTYLRRRKI